MSRIAEPVQNGNVIDYTAAAAIAVGDIVPMVSMCGVAVTDIALGAIGAVSLVGVYDVPAVTTAAFAVGDVLYWDAAAKTATKTDTGNVKLGVCIAVKAQASATARVRIG